jgi:hypothetical protein
MGTWQSVLAGGAAIVLAEPVNDSTAPDERSPSGQMTIRIADGRMGGPTKRPSSAALRRDDHLVDHRAVVGVVAEHGLDE